MPPVYFHHCYCSNQILDAVESLTKLRMLLSGCYILSLDEVVLGVTTGGWVKVWTVSEREVRPRESIFEHESKMIHSLNALCLVCCTYNQRTVLIVSQDDWQVGHYLSFDPVKGYCWFFVFV